MTTEDPNLRTNPDGTTYVLEPGDEGYVEPASEPLPPQPHEEGAVLEVELPPVSVPPGEDLRLVNEPGQSESEAIIMNRGVVVESTSPTDIVPNTPQIRPFPVEEPVEEPAGEEVVVEEPPADPVA